MKLPPFVLVLLVAIFLAKFSDAQQQHVWIPPGIETLQDSASSKSEFTFDHSMLVLASKLEQDNDDLRRVIAGVSGISIHRYHFPETSAYDPATLGAVNEEYRLAGWKHLTYSRESARGSGATDLWVRMENNAISNLAILLASAKEVTFVVVSGSISPLDLTHLGGHFGIPKIEGGVVVPNTGQRQ
jgi:hypothetical protein